MSTTKTSFGRRVLNYLKQGEEYHLERYSGHQSKFIKKQIGIREEEIEDLQEEIKDYEVTHAEIVLTPSLEAIKNVDTSKEEAESHTERIFQSRLKLVALNNTMDERKAEIKEYKGIVKDIETAELAAKEEEKNA